jgi:glycosyltransferase involved in cell wall biosynthesis
MPSSDTPSPLAGEGQGGRLRVLYDYSLAWNPAGTGTFVRGLFEALKRRPDLEVTAASFNRDPNAGLDTGAKSLGRRARSAFEHLGYYAFGLPGQAAAAKSDVICCPSSLGPLRGRIPSLVTVFDMTPYSHAGTQDRISGPYLRFMLGAGVHRARAVCTISQSVAQEITKRFPDIPVGRVHVAYPGPNPELMAAQPVPVDLPQAPFLLMVGTVEPRKNHLTALRALARHLERRPKSRLTLVMAGSAGWLYRPVLDAIQELGLSQRVIRLGVTQAGQLKWLYQRASGLLFPSLYEGFGLPVLEALYLGCPVVASRIPSVVEITGEDSALLLEPLDVEAWASAMSNLEDGPSLARVEAGRNRAAAFTWEACAESAVRALQAAAAERRA